MKASNFLLELTSVLRARWVLAAFIALAIGAAMALTLTTAGRSASLSEQVRERFTSVEARAIVVQAAPSDELSSAILRNYEGVEGVEWAVALSSSMDVTNEDIPGADPVASRKMWAADWATTGIPAPSTISSGKLAWTDATARRQLAIASFPAVVHSDSGTRIAIGGEAQPKASLRPFITGVTIATRAADATAPVTTIVVLASAPEHVVPLANLIESSLPAVPSATIRVHTSAELARASTSVGTVLDSFSQRTIVGSVFGAGALVAVLQVGVVLLQRRDYGRRRALGATRSMIAGLVIGSTVLAAMVGAILGAGLATVYLTLSNGAIPPASLVSAFGVLLVATASVLGAIPAAIAARLDPASEMRVA